MPKFRALTFTGSAFAEQDVKVEYLEAKNRQEGYGQFIRRRYSYNVLLLDEKQALALTAKLLKFEAKKEAGVTVKREDGISKKMLEGRMKELKDFLEEVEDSDVPSDVMAELVEAAQSEIAEIEKQLKR